MTITAERPSSTWTDEEWEWYALGPFDGGTPGMVRRVRRILDVSQRGLAAILGVSQSAVARWETGRTSPRVSVLEELLRLAGLRLRVHDQEGAEVRPMRADGARDRAGRRHPAHVDLRVAGWWVPRGSACSIDFWVWRARSRAERRPAIHYRRSAGVRRLERLAFGTPVDHPALHQLAAEADHLDEAREERRRWWSSPAA